MDPSAPCDRRINSDVPSVLPNSGAKDLWILWQIALGQGGHDTAGTRPIDPQSHFTESEGSSDPMILDEAFGAVLHFDHEVWAKACDFDGACGSGRSQAI